MVEMVNTHRAQRYSLHWFYQQGYNLSRRISIGEGVSIQVFIDFISPVDNPLTLRENRFGGHA
jgi:hypothetical protein